MSTGSRWQTQYNHLREDGLVDNDHPLGCEKAEGIFIFNADNEVVRFTDGMRGVVESRTALTAEIALEDGSVDHIDQFTKRYMVV